MMTLAYCIALRYDDTVGVLDGTAHVGLQLGALHRAVAVDGVDFTVVVEEHAQVVDVALHVMVLPRAADVLRGVALKALPVDVRVYVELAVGIAYAGGPHALSVDFLMVAQGETVFREVEAREAIGDVLPVHEVLGVEDDKSGHGMHGGAGQIVVVAHAQNVGVGEFVVEERVGERAIAIVGGP